MPYALGSKQPQECESHAVNQYYTPTNNHKNVTIKRQLQGNEYQFNMSLWSNFLLTVLLLCCLHGSQQQDLDTVINKLAQKVAESQV